VSEPEFQVDLDRRRVTHVPSGTTFSFYAYESEQAWRAAGPSTASLADGSPAAGADLNALGRLAKAAAVGAGMKAQR
jgi:hypothetical protein